MAFVIDQIDLLGYVAPDARLRDAAARTLAFWERDPKVVIQDGADL